MTLEIFSAISSAIGVVVALVALAVAWVTLGRANKIGSAGTFTALYPQVDAAWVKIVEHQDDENRFPVSAGGLFNYLETAAFLYYEGVFSGEMRGFIKKFVQDSLNNIYSNKKLEDEFKKYIQGDNITFKYLVKIRSENSAV